MIDCSIIKPLVVDCFLLKHVMAEQVKASLGQKVLGVLGTLEKTFQPDLARSGITTPF